MYRFESAFALRACRVVIYAPVSWLPLHAEQHGRRGASIAESAACHCGLGRDAFGTPVDPTAAPPCVGEMCQTDFRMTHSGNRDSAVVGEAN